MKKFIFTLLILLSSNLIFAINYKIGVLARDGEERCIEEWQPTIDYLNNKLPYHKCELVTLEYDKVLPAINQKEIDFIIANPTLYITSKRKYNTKAIATMIVSIDGKPIKAFGGTIFTSAENKDINSLNDIKGKIFAGVSPFAFGGWQMAYKELIDNGIDPFKDFKELSWGVKQEFAVMKVIIGEADAGTARTDTIEKMISKGIIQKDELKILNQKNYPEFPFISSTILYPEYPLFIIEDIDQKLVNEVLKALKLITSDNDAAKKAKIIGWSDPLDYSSVDDLLKTLKLGAYAE